MKAIILLGTLKKTGLSNTETLSEFLAARFRRQDIECEIIKLVEYQIVPGTCTDMGVADDWPDILQRVLDCDIVVFATPVWWDNHSSLIQRVIERLDELHDRIMAGDGSPLEGKAGGVVVTGDSDGAQHIIGMLCNFFNAVGLAIPPYASLTVLWDRQAKSASPTREELMQKYESDYTGTADTMVRGLARLAGR